jgi:anti-sigma-K factor RskA
MAGVAFDTVKLARRLHEQAGFWRNASAVLAVVALAFLVAALVRRPPPDLAAQRVVAVVVDGVGRPAWAIRLAAEAHQIAADSLAPEPVAPGRVYQLWLAPGGGARPEPLGLLPQAGRKSIPVSPEAARRLGGAGQLVVTDEPVGGSPQPGPTGPVRFRGALDGRSGK